MLRLDFQMGRVEWFMCKDRRARGGGRWVRIAVWIVVQLSVRKEIAYSDPIVIVDTHGPCTLRIIINYNKP